MNFPQDFQKLVTQASHEVVPQVDVTGAVLERIARRPGIRPYHDPLPWMAGFSLTAALIVLFSVYGTWETVQDPLMSLVEPFRLALP